MRNINILRNKHYFLLKQSIYSSHIKDYNMTEKNFLEDITLMWFLQEDEGTTDTRNAIIKIRAC